MQEKQQTRRTRKVQVCGDEWRSSCLAIIEKRNKEEV